MAEVFRRFAHRVSQLTGSVAAFSLAVLVVVVWLVTGPLFGFADTWQLVINTGTTIVTFLMVFLIQNTQNRESQAVHAKLDEMIYRIHDADNRVIEAEDLTEEELGELKRHYTQLAESLGTRRRSGGHDDKPDGESFTEGSAKKRLRRDTSSKNEANASSRS